MSISKNAQQSERMAGTAALGGVRLRGAFSYAARRLLTQVVGRSAVKNLAAAPINMYWFLNSG